MSRRYKSLHHNLKEGENIVYHREHIAWKNRNPGNASYMRKFKLTERRKWKNDMRKKVGAVKSLVL